MIFVIDFLIKIFLPSSLRPIVLFYFEMVCAKINACVSLQPQTVSLWTPQACNTHWPNFNRLTSGQRSEFACVVLGCRLWETMATGTPVLGYLVAGYTILGYILLLPPLSSTTSKCGLSPLVFIKLSPMRFASFFIQLCVHNSSSCFVLFFK